MSRIVINADFSDTVTTTDLIRFLSACSDVIDNPVVDNVNDKASGFDITVTGQAPGRKEVKSWQGGEIRQALTPEAFETGTTRNHERPQNARHDSWPEWTDVPNLTPVTTASGEVWRRNGDDAEIRDIKRNWHVAPYHPENGPFERLARRYQS